MRLHFDRGTVLLDEPPPGLDTGSLPGTLWDPRVRAYRAPACSHADLRSALSESGVAFDDDVRRCGRGPGVVSAPSLRPYQRAAIDAWELAGRRGTIVLPTGSGKTRVAIAAVARLRATSLCLVPTRVLLEQWCDEIAKHYQGQVGCYGNGVRRLGGITVSTFASAERHMERIGNRFDMLVVDEVHNVAGGAYTDALDMSIAAARMGLTATPPRDPHSLDRLGRVVGPVVYELAVGDLAGSFLAPYDLVTLFLDLTGSERARYERDMGVFRSVFLRFRTSSPASSWAAFARAANRSDEGRRALASWRRAKQLIAYTTTKREVLGGLLERHAESRMLVFTANNESAYAIAREHLVMPITCDIKRKEREEALERFRAGELRTLVSARVLNEGFDVPDAEVAIVVGGSLGEREHVQRIGRLLRPATGKRALVYELVSRATMEVGQAKRRRASLAPQVTAQL